MANNDKDVKIPPPPKEPDITSFYGDEKDTHDLEKEIDEQQPGKD